jgi:hypothetical protein
MKEKDYTQPLKFIKMPCNKPSDEETRYNYALAKKDAERKSA